MRVHEKTLLYCDICERHCLELCVCISMSCADTCLHYPGEELVEEKQLALKCLEEEEKK